MGLSHGSRDGFRPAFARMNREIGRLFFVGCDARNCIRTVKSWENYSIPNCPQGNRASEAFDECSQEVIAPSCLFELHAV